MSTTPHVVSEGVRRMAQGGFDRKVAANTTALDLFSQRFDGETYEHPKDSSRLTAQLNRVKGLMLDGQWRTLADIEAATGDPQASVSARLRDLRKPRFGSYDVFRRRKGPGTFEYRVEAKP